LNLRSLSGEGAGVRLSKTELAAVGTGLLFGEFVGLLFQEQLKGSFRKSVGRYGSDLLEGTEIDIQTRSVVAKGSLGNNFGPL
jgi:hypothetical protein